MTEAEIFREILTNELSNELTSNQIDRIVEFRDAVIQENSVQNLTRLLSPRDFVDGHVLDVIHLKKSGFLTFPTLDLGAGMGVPGILYALIYGSDKAQSWISCDSEKTKADFASRVVNHFGLDAVEITSSRAEVYLSIHGEIETIVMRAVGTISRIFAWLDRCSTWNKLILLKGPRWEEEWSEFQATSRRDKLSIGGTYRYEVGSEKKTRIIVEILRT